MRTVALMNYSFKPPKELGRAVLQSSGAVTLTGFNGILAMELRQGIEIGKETVLPAQGSLFLDAMLKAYRGTYVKATEITGASR